MVKQPIITLIIMAFVGCFGCRDPGHLAPLAPGATVLCFGDSLTYGTGAEPGRSYPDELGRIINRPVVNAGIPGETSGEALARLPGELDRVNPRLLILCSGANDILRRMDLGQAATNVREMVMIAQERGTGVVLVGVPQWGLGLKPAPFYREIGKERGVPVEDRILAKVLGRGSLKTDPVHPNAAGYRKIAEAVAAVIARSGGI